MGYPTEPGIYLSRWDVVGLTVCALMLVVAIALLGYLVCAVMHD